MPCCLQGTHLSRTLLVVAAVVGIAQSAQLGTLPKELYGFELSSGVSASMRDINGGRYCVGAMGKQPASYEWNGDIDLETCAQIASSQEGVSGFRWGRKSINEQAFIDLEKTDAAVDLQSLFYNPGRDAYEKYSCSIYVRHYTADEDEKMRPSNFTNSSLAKSLGFSPKMHDGPGEQVCTQRWTLLQFFMPVESFWFCYGLASKEQECGEERRSFFNQSTLFGVFALLFTVFFAYLLAGQKECVEVLMWSARVSMGLETGLLAVSILVEKRAYEGWQFYFIAVGLGYLLLLCTMLPLYVWEFCVSSSPGSAGSIFYMLCLLFSTSFFFEYMSYHHAFLHIQHFHPILVSCSIVGLEVLQWAMYQHHIKILGFFGISEAGSARMVEDLYYEDNQFLSVYPE